MTPTIFHSSKARSCLTERKEIYFPSIYFCWAYVWNSWLANHKKEYKKTCLYICSSRLRPTDIFQLVWRFHFLCTLKNYVSLKFQTRNYIVDLVNCTQDFDTYRINRLTTLPNMNCLFNTWCFCLYLYFVLSYFLFCAW